MLTLHPAYLALGSTAALRANAYQALFAEARTARFAGIRPAHRPRSRPRSCG